MKTWLKGGLIGMGAIIFIDILSFILASYSPLSNLGEFIILIQVITIGIPLIIFNVIDAQYLHTADKLILIIWSSIIFFLIGSIIGLIVQKIKSKKINSQNHIQQFS